MNDSNYSLRFSRSYKEATGKRIHSGDFEQDKPIVTGKEAIFWLSILGIVSFIGYLLIKGFDYESL
jgi:hypothetical protein